MLSTVMDKMSIVAASGLRSRLEALDVLANNLANSATSGYKADNELYGTYAGEAAEAMQGGMTSSLPDIRSRWTNFQQGTLELTGNPQDVAISGEGFFTVKSPTGLMYTRDGHMKVAKDGSLTNSDGYPMVDASGKTITLAGAQAFEISNDGQVRQGGQPVGQLTVVQFPKPEALEKTGYSYFKANEASGKPTPATDADVHQGKIEASNVAPAESAVRLVSLMRQAEFLQRAITMGADMGKRAIEEVGRVGS
ncbi:flagellar hook-basal body protein [uncultured Paludibaculum sp.]|uniref:flagellar hook-basal body protein n=1 Tax=uncultured Paludibaculum sp. TaxID=1765020 RepID=UPI00374CC99D